MEEGIRICIFHTSLRPRSRRLDYGVEALCFDPLVGVGVPVCDCCLDGLREITDRLGEGLRFVDRFLPAVPVG